MGRFPVLSDGKKGDVSNDFGGALLRLKMKIPDSKKTNRFYRQVKKQNKKSLNANSVLGKGTIRKRMLGAFKKMGVSNNFLRSHALRGEFITRLANDDSVNAQETMSAARHRSITASSAYQKTSKKSESNRFGALFKNRKIDELEDADVKSAVSKIDVLEDADVKSVVSIPSESNSVQDILVRNEETAHTENNGCKKFSIFTQAALNGLRHDLSRMQQNVSSSSPSSGKWTWNLDFEEPSGPTPNRRPSPLNPYNTTRDIDNTSRASSSHSSRNFACNMATCSSSRVPSDRESEIISLRQNVRSLEHEVRMMTYPYRNNEDDNEELYRDYLAHSYECDGEMNNRIKRRKRYHRQSNYYRRCPF